MLLIKYLMNCDIGISKYQRHSESVYDFSRVEQSGRNWEAVLDLIGGKLTVVVLL